MTTKASRIFEVLLVVFLASLYIAVPIYITDELVIPSAFTLLVVSPVILLALHRRIRNYDVAFLVMLFCLVLLTAVLSPGQDYLGQKLLGLAQVTTSVATGILLFKLLNRVGSPKVAKILLVSSVVLVIGSSLEIMGSFWSGLGMIRAASDAFREVAYSSSGYGVYDAALRDANITGFERAKFFSSEPSVLAKGFLILVNSWLLLSYNRRNLSIGMLLTAMLFVLTGSPVLVVSAVISSAIALTADRNLLRSLVKLLPLTVFLALGVGIILLALNPDIVGNTVQRFQSAFSLGMSSTSLTKDSTGLRLFVPAITLIDVWQNSPLFGVGISGKEAAEVYMSLAIPPEHAFGNNFMAVLIYFGIIGTALFIALLSWYFRKLKIRSMPLLFLILVAFSFTGGGFEEARFWGYVFLLIWAVKKRDEAFDQNRPSVVVPPVYRQDKNVVFRSGARQIRKA